VDVNYKCMSLYLRAHLHIVVTRDGQMASSAPPFSAGTESEPILRTKAILFPFHAQWCNVPMKTNGRKNSPQTISIFGYDNRKSTSTIRPWSIREKEKSRSLRYHGYIWIRINFVRIYINIITNIYVIYSWKAKHCII